jgi:DnaK suppressor protein
MAKLSIKFPTNILKPIANFFRREEERLLKRKKVLEKEDPFSDTIRLTENAAADADAAEQFGHARVEALRQQIDRRLIDIRKAVTRIKIGKYGTCEKCGRMIDTDRLMIKPEATLCIECEKKREK